MAQSSALRQAADPAPTHITINSNNVPNPKNADVPSGGSVQFNAANACWLYFAPTGVFGDANGRLELSQGNNGPFYPGQSNVTVSYCVTAPNTTCTPLAADLAATNVASIEGSKLPAGGGNTIHVG
jgi:hypothetical protein